MSQAGSSLTLPDMLRAWLALPARLRALLIGAVVFLVTIAAAHQAQPASAEKEVPPAEDLMREHGVLRHALLVYREGLRRIDEGRPTPAPELLGAAALIRRFVEDYHEKQQYTPK